MKLPVVKIGVLLTATLCAAAAQSATVSVGDGAVRPGGTVAIAVSVDAGLGLGGVNLRLESDPGLFVSANVSRGPLLGGSHFLASHVPAAGRLNVVAYAPPGAPAFGGQAGIVFTLSLHVSPSAAPGEYPITFSAVGTPLLASSGMSDISGTSIAHGTDPGSVTVFEGLAADVNSDGDVTGADLIIIIRDWHKSSAYPYEPFLDADLNRDEQVDEVDLMIFHKDWQAAPPRPKP